MSSVQTNLTWGAATDRGRRAANEDSYLAQHPVFLVADGMGGHEGGAEASRAAVEAFAPLQGRVDVTVDDVEAAYRSAAEVVRAIGTHRLAAGTTLAGVVMVETAGSAYWLVINIGDSRVYRLGEGVLEQISTDHSAVQALIDSGDLDPRSAETHPQRNVVTRAVGGGSTGMPDYWMLPVAAGDRLLVCSDGLTKELGADEISAVLRAEASAQAAATRLVHEALLHGGRDNVTVVVVDAHQAGVDDDDPTHPAPEEGTAVAHV